jgi:GNAT superfamily N-acetyltransferase
MAWRSKPAAFKKNKGDGNRRAMKRLIDAGAVPGLIGYIDSQPVAWCSIGLRSDFSALDRSRVLAPVDDQTVWSVSCMFVAKEHRRKGLSVRMLKAAAKYVREQGALILEGYPYEPDGTLPDPFVWTGLASAYLRAGFKEVARRSRTRPIMRRGLRPSHK